MLRLIGLLMAIAGALFLCEHFLLAKESFASEVDLSTIHEDINNLITVVTECFFILFGLVLLAGNFTERKKSESVIKRTHNLTEIEVSTLVHETPTGSFELDESSVEELALSYQTECPHRNVNDIISLKSLEIAAITQLLPSAVRDLFEPLLRSKLVQFDDSRTGA
ncbi:hypothetical protein [Pantoea sp. ICBG 1758]|uniref:hypothetical protein n=1 Tax=Pantoea sp. ICBG 1758 TaxID=2071682 RepID=UPI0011B0AE5B|nr:hypothetical protein [Pantoea sp. ICBG 1758]